jgi:hypothetical protein
MRKINFIIRPLDKGGTGDLRLKRFSTNPPLASLTAPFIKGADLMRLSALR